MLSSVPLKLMLGLVLCFTALIGWTGAAVVPEHRHRPEAVSTRFSWKDLTRDVYHHRNLTHTHTVEHQKPPSWANTTSGPNYTDYCGFHEFEKDTFMNTTLMADFHKLYDCFHKYPGREETDHFLVDFLVPLFTKTPKQNAHCNIESQCYVCSPKQQSSFGIANM